MGKWVCLLLLLSASLIAPGVSAGAPRQQGFWTAAAEQLVPDRPDKTALPSRGARLDNRQAASQVKKRYAGHKILSINLMQSPGPVTYRVKTLSRDGVVKYVYVDGNSGAVFE